MVGKGGGDGGGLAASAANSRGLFHWLGQVSAGGRRSADGARHYAGGQVWADIPGDPVLCPLKTKVTFVTDDISAPRAPEQSEESLKEAEGHGGVEEGPHTEPVAPLRRRKLHPAVTNLTVQPRVHLQAFTCREEPQVSGG